MITGYKDNYPNNKKGMLHQHPFFILQKPGNTKKIFYSNIFCLILLSGYLCRMKKQTNTLEYLRSRWTRWLGAMCRQDRASWIDLLDATWLAWVARVLGEDNERLGYLSPREEVKMAYSSAIARASLDDFRRLDAILVTLKLKA